MAIAIFTDGGARGNPGPAGAGAVIEKDDVEVGHVSAFLGVRTNNWAEYEALIRALDEARRLFGVVPEPVVVYMDSELIVKQMRGEYRVRDAALKIQHERVRALVREFFPHITFTHIRREKNMRADQYANDAMDRGA